MSIFFVNDLDIVKSQDTINYKKKIRITTNVSYNLKISKILFV